MSRGLLFVLLALLIVPAANAHEVRPAWLQITEMQEDGTYAFVGDPWHCKTQGLRKYYGKMPKLSEELSKNYAVEEAIDSLEQHWTQTFRILFGDAG